MLVAEDLYCIIACPSVHAATASCMLYASRSGSSAARGTQMETIRSTPVAMAGGGALAAGAAAIALHGCYASHLKRRTNGRSRREILDTLER
eukprot:COSAG06_NODE_23810_length_681_cov_0.498282_2_plen_91_part_01